MFPRDIGHGYFGGDAERSISILIGGFLAGDGLGVAPRAASLGTEGRSRSVRFVACV